MMNPAIVDLKDVAWTTAQRGRVKSVRTKRLPLDSGIPGVVLECSYALVPDGYYTPRHRHNFDQVRLGLEGTFNIEGSDLRAGECGYYSEGVYYGPQAQKGDAIILILQFQGANGDRFVSDEELNATVARMVAEGAVFEDGVYKGKKPDGRPDNKDSFRAIWERLEGRPLEYPKPRYSDPVMMNPALFRWVADRRLPGVSRKHLGTFTELRTGVGCLRLEAGASIPAGEQEDAEIRYLLEGEAMYGDRPCGKDTYFYLPPGCRPDALKAKTQSTFFTISLPMIAELATRATADH